MYKYSKYGKKPPKFSASFGFANLKYIGVIALVAAMIIGYQIITDEERESILKEERLLFAKAVTEQDVTNYIKDCKVCEQTEEAEKKIAELAAERQKKKEQKELSEKEYHYYLKAKTVTELQNYLDKCEVCKYETEAKAELKKELLKHPQPVPELKMPERIKNNSEQESESSLNATFLLLIILAGGLIVVARKGMQNFGKGLLRVISEFKANQNLAAQKQLEQKLFAEKRKQEQLAKQLEEKQKEAEREAAKRLELEWRLNALEKQAKEIKPPKKVIPAPVVSESNNEKTIIQGTDLTGFENLSGLKIIQDKMKCGALAPKMVLIPAGSFLIGSPETETDRSSDEKQHRVSIEKPFYIGQFAVTFAEYDLFCEQTKVKKGFIFKTKQPREKPDDYGWGRGQRPVINVSWFDAIAYCEWLSKQTGQRYFLPTEAQWEYACRAGTTTPFAFGETISTEQANYDGNYVYGKGKKGEYRGKTVEVGSFPPNAWDLYDMHGNVWEWTGSAYDENYKGGEQLIGNNDAKMPRVLRGGSWFGYPDWLRSAYRGGSTPGNRYDSLGFRLSRM